MIIVLAFSSLVDEVCLNFLFDALLEGCGFFASGYICM